MCHIRKTSSHNQQRSLLRNSKPQKIKFSSSSINQPSIYNLCMQCLMHTSTTTSPYLFRIFINQIKLFNNASFLSHKQDQHLTFNKTKQQKKMHMSFIPHMLKSITLLQEHYLPTIYRYTVQQNNKIFVISV